MQPELTVGAFQFNVVLVAVVEDAARPEGAPGTAVQVLAGVVTWRDALWLPVPAESVAATLNVNVLPGDNPLTEKVGFAAVPIDAPF